MMNRLAPLLLAFLLLSCGDEPEAPQETPWPPFCKVDGYDLPCYLKRPPSKVQVRSYRDSIRLSPGAARPKRMVLKTINARVPGLRPIYVKFFPSQDERRIDVTLRWTILPSGQMDTNTIAVVNASVPDSQFCEAIKNKIKKWQWEKIQEGNTTVTTSIHFQTSPQKDIPLPPRLDPNWILWLVPSFLAGDYVYVPGEPNPKFPLMDEPATSDRIEKLFEEFRQTDFPSVRRAKEELENLQGKIIPRLLDFLDDTNRVRLVRAEGFVYPGGLQQGGPGELIDYALDYLAVRAGWLLEDLTFQDFGYLTFELPKENQRIRETQKAQIALFSKRAHDWWQKNAGHWRRIDGIKEALRSGDLEREWAARIYLGFGTTRCDNLDPFVYEFEVKPLLLRIYDTSQGVGSRHALEELIQNGPSPDLLATKKLGLFQKPPPRKR
jgi:hypothetical protein